MRVTNNMMILNMMENMNRNLVNMSKYQDQLATGKAISSPMDDPVGIAKVLKYKTDLTELDQFEKNTRDALSWLENTESAMIDLNSSYQRMRELAVAAGNDTNSADETQKIKDEILQLQEHVKNLANATFAGRYIFSGSHTDEKLMNEDGTFNIAMTTNEVSSTFSTRYQLGVGENIEVSTNGLDLFGYESLSNLMTTFFPNSNDEGTAAKPGTTSGIMDLDIDHSANDYNIQINGTAPNYDVDESKLVGTAQYPLKKEDVISVFKSASNGTNTLGDVADVYFDSNGKLTITTKANGLGNTVTEPGNDLFTASTVGADNINASVAGTVMTDGDVNAETTLQSFVVTYNGESREIEINMGSYTTVAGLTAGLQTEIDNALSDVLSYTAGDISVTSPGGVLTFTTTEAATSTKKSVLEVRPVVTTKSTLMQDIDDFTAALETKDNVGIEKFLSDIDVHINNLLTERSNVGARTNRMELVLNRIAENNVNFTRLLSDTEDADMSEVIMYLKNSENVYRASLQTGARVIQPSLMDFLR